MSATQVDIEGETKKKLHTHTKKKRVNRAFEMCLTTVCIMLNQDYWYYKLMMQYLLNEVQPTLSKWTPLQGRHPSKATAVPSLATF